MSIVIYLTAPPLPGSWADPIAAFPTDLRIVSQKGFTPTASMTAPSDLFLFRLRHNDAQQRALLLSDDLEFTQCRWQQSPRYGR